MRGRGLCPGILATLGADLGVFAVAGMAMAGCGDVPACQSEVFVAFTQTTVTSDADDFAPGVQANIRIRTSLRIGDVVELEILDTGGALQGTVTRGVDRDGIAVFDYVTLPTPRAVLRATGSGLCGRGQDQITIDVPVGATCRLDISPAPERNAHYAPLGVLSTRSDPDPVTPGYQATIRAVTRPGWTAQLYRIAGEEQSFGEIAADDDGVATWAVTVIDGLVGFRATCRGQGTELASPRTTVVADTTPPGCEIVAPAPGATITAAWDENHDLGDGLQLAVAARTADLDVAGEPGSLTITEGGVAAVVPTSAVADGASRAEVTLLPPITPATYDFAFTLHDHAGNACMSLATYEVISQ